MAKEVLTEERHKNDHHHHEESCGCGHDHHHEDACGCGHNHHHEDACGCGHDHHHEEHKEADHTFDHAEKQVYILENLGCAHCASKMEEKIQALPQVEFAAITFATKQLQVVTNTDAELLEEFQKICASIESEVVVRKRDGGSTGKRESAKGRFSESKKDLWEIGIGAVLFVLGLFTQEMNGWISFFTLIIGYLILGKDVLITAAKNIGKGRVFDENFLMGVATIAAIVIGDYKEAVGVMLFYRVGELFEDIAVARSRSQIMEAVDLRPEVVNLVEQDGTIREIPAEEAKVGDVLLVRAGDRIPLEGVVLEGESRLDTSPVTGEPVPVARCTGQQCDFWMCESFRCAENACREGSGRFHGYKNFEFSRKCSSQQAKNRPFYYKVFKSIHTGRGSTGSGNSNYPVDPDRGLELLDLHSHYLPGNQLSMCACVECSTGIFLRNRSGF